MAIPKTAALPLGYAPIGCAQPLFVQRSERQHNQAARTGQSLNALNRTGFFVQQRQPRLLDRIFAFGAGNRPPQLKLHEPAGKGPRKNTGSAPKSPENPANQDGLRGGNGPAIRTPRLRRAALSWCRHRRSSMTHCPDAGF